MAGIIDQLQEQYEQVLGKLLPYKPAYPFHHKIQARRTDDGSAHVEVIDGALHYVVTERGSELHRRVAADSDELLFWLVDDLTSAIAWKRKQPLFSKLLGRDSRRHRFSMHVKLLSMVSHDWARKKRAYYDNLLLHYPYRDKAWQSD